MSVIFLSHSSSDDEPAAELKAWLEARGHGSLFLDFDPEAGIPAGRDWERELYRQLKSCRALVILCSPRSMASKWCFAELAIARSLGKPIFPLLVEPCELPAQLTEVQVLDLAAEDAEAAFAKLAHGLAAAGVEAAGDLAWDRSRSPYPGLLAFEEADAAIFFGREREIGDAKELLEQARRYGETGLLLVLGASGSGKSSLVRAGLLPRLRADRERWLIVDPFRPRNEPLRELAAALAETSSRLGAPVRWRDLLDRLGAELAADPSSPRVLDEMLEDLRLGAGRRDARPLLVVDQFEELLGHGPDHPAHRFLRLLRVALDRPDPPLLVLGTMRSDFLGAFQTDAALADLAFTSLSLGPLPAESLARTIEGPAELVGLELEPGLVPALLRDMETDDALPLLAFTLSELYAGCKDGGRMRLAAYRDELGGLQGSVAKAANRVLAARRYSEDDLDDLKIAVLSLARLDQDGRTARRSPSWEEIGRRLGGVERAKALLGPFVEARLLVSRGDDDASSIEVAHEALFRSWEILARWLDHNRDDLRLQADLAHAASRWEKGGRGEDFLWRGGRLERAEELADKGTVPMGDGELDFVRAGAAIERRRRRRGRVLVSAVVAAALLVAAVMGWLARREGRSRVLADRQVSRYLARDAADHLGSELDLALLLGVKAYRTAPTFESTSVLLSALKSAPRLLSYLPGATRTVRAVAVDPAGGRVAFGGHDARLYLWSLAGERIDCEAILPGNKNWIGGLAFGPGGEVLASGSDDGVVRLWRASDCSPIADLGRHEGRVSGLAVAGRGWVVSGGDDGRVKVWPIDGEGAYDLGGLSAAVQSVAVSGDGRRAAAGGLDGGIQVWDLEKRERLDDVARRHDSAVSALAFTADGRFLASGSGDEAPLRLWDLESPAAGGEIPEVPTHDGPVLSLAFSRGVLASASQSGEIRVWDVLDPRRRLEIAGGGSPVQGVALDPRDPTRLVSASGDRGSVRLWDVALRGDRNLLGLVAPTSVAFGPAGHRLLVVDEGTVGFLDPVTGAPEGEPFSRSAAGEEVTAIAYGGDGKFLAAGGDDGVVRLWDPVSRAPWPLPDGHDGAVGALAFSADGRLVASGGQDSSVRLWSVGDRRLRFAVAHDDWVNTVAFSPDAQTLASGSDDGTVRLWSAGSGELLATPLAPGEENAFPASVKSVAFSPGGLLAVGSDDGSVRLFGSRREPLPEAPIQVALEASAVAFSSDGRTLGVGSSGGSLELWTLSSRPRVGGSGMAPLLRLATIEDPNGISALAFHPRKAVLAIVRYGSAELLDLTGIDAWAARACRRANRNLTAAEWTKYVGADVPYVTLCPGRPVPEPGTDGRSPATVVERGL